MFKFYQWGEKHRNAFVFVSVIRRLVVRAISVAFTLTILLLSACHQLAPATAANWFCKGCAMCYHVYVIMHVKDP